MGSKVVVTYKRKRLFSRSDRSTINLRSDKPPEISDSKRSANFDNHEESIAQHALLNKHTGFGTCHFCSKDKVGENMLHSENQDSQYYGRCSEKQAHKLQRLCSICTKQQNSSVSNQSGKPILDQRTHFQDSHVKQITVHSDARLEGSPEEIRQFESAGRPNAEENEDKCKETNSTSLTRGAVSGIESDVVRPETADGINCSRQMDTSISGMSLEERDELNKDHYIGLCNNNLVAKRKLASTLITFCRRSKRNKDNAPNDIAAECTDKHAFEKPIAASCSIDVKNEKKPPEDTVNSCSSSSPEDATVTHADNPAHFSQGIVKDGPTAMGQDFENSHEEMSSLEEKVCMDVHDNHRINATLQDLSSEDAKIAPSNISTKRDSISSLDLSISPPAFRDIDCNIPLDCDSDENHQPGHFEGFRDYRDSASKINENMPKLEVQCAGSDSPVAVVSDKGKCIVESPPVENNFIQFFPETRSNETLRLANDPEKVTGLLPSSLQSSRIHNLSLKSEPVVNSRAYYSSLYDWPHLQLREPLHDFLPSTSNRSDSLSRHLMMFDNMLSRARGKFEFPTTWSEEELDCLWVGVRRHGVNNFDAMLRDPRLHFSPWKTARNLADRWRDEQYQLFHCRPVSQVEYTGRPDFLSNHMTGVQLLPRLQQTPIRECGSGKRPSVVHYMDLARNRQFQKPVTNDYSVKESLPHWLREAVAIPRPSGPARSVVSSVCNVNFGCSGKSQQPLMNTKNVPGRSGQIEVRECRTNNKQDDWIIINGDADASSEETVSDDRSIRLS